ncbi:hypothetical protein HK407_12g18600 [Ordospora pajunii]|uniref:uncharacterized protein n=1 Tax=Ordospora pajunii TaxID=3039483 RepID=UPI0029528113|nr:uncharacterized protein HK407_12g18600 [Ordospora pajunii]KAH9410728.1 hypothetical protein HK407_12g18600 [Ordospora pajunii]
MDYTLTTVMKIHQGWIKSIDIDPYDAFVASSSMDRSIKLVDIKTKQLLASISQKSVCEDVRFSTKHPYLFCASLDGLIRCYDLIDREFIKEYYGHMSSVLCLDTCEDMLFSGSADCTVRGWDIRSRSCTSIMKGHTLPINRVIYRHSNVYSCSMDGCINVWDERNTRSCVAMLSSSASDMCFCGDTLFISNSKAVFECNQPSDAVLQIDTLCLQHYDNQHYIIGSEEFILIKSKNTGIPDHRINIFGMANTLKATSDRTKIIVGGTSKNMEFLEKNEHGI